MDRQVEAEVPHAVGLSIVMLIQVLDGATYADVGLTHGVSSTTVECRIKRLARRLSQLVKIEGMSDKDIASERHLRARRQTVLDALDGVGPARLASPVKDGAAKAYSPDQLEAGAERIRASSKHPLRDVALFLLLHTTDVRPLEVARLRVCDYLQADGEVRQKSELRAKLAFDGIARPLSFYSTTLNETLLHYLRTLVPESYLPDGGELVDLLAEQPLFLTDDGNGFAITQYAYRGRHRYLCHPILETCRKIFRHAGLPYGAFPVLRNTTAEHRYAHAVDDE